MRPIHDGSGPLLSSAMAPSTSSVLNATTKSANQSWPGRSSLVPHVDRSHSSLATSDKEKDRQFEQYVKPSNETRPILIHSPINQHADHCFRSHCCASLSPPVTNAMGLVHLSAHFPQHACHFVNAMPNIGNENYSIFILSLVVLCHSGPADTRSFQACSP